jgi:hypothetical protein
MAIPEVKKSKLVIDADTLLMITIYVLTQSKETLASLHSHLNLIYEFSTDSQKMS